MIFPPLHIEVSKGHGRIETRTIQTSTALNDYLDFPHVHQVFRIKRQVTDLLGKNPREETAYGLTSLTEDKASPADVLAYNRGHWAIENELHWVRDVTFDEDRSRIRAENGPQVMASLRNLSIGLLRRAGYRHQIAKGLRHCCWNVKQTFRLIGLKIA